MRYPLTLAATILLFSATAAEAQSYITSPPGMTESSGGSYALNWAYYLQGSRQQFIDTAIARKSVGITRLDLRTTTSFSYNKTLSGMGRTFTSVSLTMGHADYDKATFTMSTNYIGSGTEVFSGKLTLDSQSGWLTQTWGNAGSFPFAKTFTYNGKDDLLMDWTFSKATLANGNSSACCAGYYLDAESTGTQILMTPSGTGSSTAYWPRTPFESPICHGTGASARGATIDMAAVVYGEHHTDKTVRGKLLLSRVYSWYTAPNTATLALLTVGGSDKGIAAGASCQKYHLSGFVLALLSGKSNKYTTGFTNFDVKPVYQPYSNTYAGLDIWSQAAWTDPKKGFSLTLANKFTLPRKPTDDKAAYVYDAKIGAGSTRGIRRRGMFDNPVERLTIK